MHRDVNALTEGMETVSSQLYDRGIELDDRVWWVGAAMADGTFQSNIYLIEQGDRSVLIDPGSALSAEATADQINAIVGLRNVRWVICSQPDVDKVAALPLLLARGLHPDVSIITHWRAHSALGRAGFSLPYRSIDDDHHRIELDDRSLHFLLTPYLRSAGAFATFDEVSKILFSSDLFGSFDSGQSLFVDTAADLDAVQRFHEYSVASRDVLAHALLAVRSVTPRMLAPQHGRVIPQDFVDDAIDILDDLDCGALLLTPDDPGLSFLFAANRTIHGVINKMVKEHDFSSVVAYLAGLAVKTLGAEYFELWAGTEGVLFRFERGDDYAGHRDDPPVDVASVLAGETIEPGRRLVLALRSPTSGSIDGAMVWGFRERWAPSDATIVVLEQIISLVEVGVEREILRRTTNIELSDWHNRAIYDPLTGLRNRSSLSDNYHQLAAFDDRNPDPQMAALMIDVDHFKGVNDTFGHASGDRLLQRIAHTIVQGVRPSDPAFRLGGEEFLVLLSNVDATSARRAAERIRENVTRSAPDLPIVTVSVGLALRCVNETLESLLARADVALYVAKESGRDRVEEAP